MQSFEDMWKEAGIGLGEWVVKASCMQGYIIFVLWNTHRFNGVKSQKPTIL